MNKRYIKNLAQRLIQRTPQQAEATLHHLRRKDELLAETVIAEMIALIAIRDR